MTVESSSTGDALGKLSLRTGAELRLSDDELLALCAQDPELRIERSADGELIVIARLGWLIDPPRSTCTR